MKGKAKSRSSRAGLPVPRRTHPPSSALRPRVTTLNALVRALPVLSRAAVMEYLAAEKPSSSQAMLLETTRRRGSSRVISSWRSATDEELNKAAERCDDRAGRRAAEHPGCSPAVAQEDCHA